MSPREISGENRRAAKRRRHGYRGYGSPLHEGQGGNIHWGRGFNGLGFPGEEGALRLPGAEIFSEGSGVDKTRS